MDESIPFEEQSEVQKGPSTNSIKRVNPSKSRDRNGYTTSRDRRLENKERDESKERQYQPRDRERDESREIYYQQRDRGRDESRDRGRDESIERYY